MAEIPSPLIRGEQRLSSVPLFCLLITLLIASFVLSICVGDVTYTPATLWHSISGTYGQAERILILDLRIPRAINTCTVGALLAGSGVLMQTLLRNPLADPYILGVSGGASAAALFAIFFGVSTSYFLTIAATAGAFTAITLVFALTKLGSNLWDTQRLLLTGVVLAAGWGAIINLLLAITPDHATKGMIFWLIGDISYGSIHYFPMIVLFLGSILSIALARPLDIMLTGELQAKSLGVNTNTLRWLVLTLCSLLTAAAVIHAGSIGFIGLIIPHMMRFIVGSSHYHLIPASIIAGGALLMLADAIARTLIAPQQLPVGVVTAFIGIPAFLIILSRLSPKNA